MRGLDPFGGGLPDEIGAEKRPPRGSRPLSTSPEGTGILKQTNDKRSPSPFDDEVRGDETAGHVNGWSSEGKVARFESRLQPFISRLNSHLLSSALSDVTLRADAVDFPCHRLVLACSSEYFARMFEGSPADASRSLIELPGKRPDAVRSVLRLLYFDCTPKEVVADGGVDHLVVVLELAIEWLLHDVQAGIKAYVDREVVDADALQVLLMRLGQSEEMRELMIMCQTRLRAINDINHGAETQMRNRDFGSEPVNSDRWTRRQDLWTSPMKCPMGLGW